MTTNTVPAPHITQLRQHLMDTLADLRDREKPMEPDRARAVAQVAGVLVDAAKVEIDYIKATGQERSEFLGTQADTRAGGSAITVETRGLPNGISSITRHRIEG